MVLLGVTATSRLALGQLRVETSRLVGLAKLHAFHGLLAVVTLAEITSRGPTGRVDYDLLAIGHLSLGRLHRVKSSLVLW